MILCKIKNVELYSEEPERFRPYIDHISGTNRDEPPGDDHSGKCGKDALCQRPV